MQHLASALWPTFSKSMQDSYQGRCIHSGIWEDNCILAHQNATREPIVALTIDSQPYELPAYSR